MWRSTSSSVHCRAVEGEAAPFPWPSSDSFEASTAAAGSSMGSIMGSFGPSAPPGSDPSSLSGEETGLGSSYRKNTCRNQMSPRTESGGSARAFGVSSISWRMSRYS